VYRPRGEFEKSDSYYRAQARYLAGEAAAAEARPAGRVVGGAAVELRKLQAYRGELEKRLYRYYFTPDRLLLERYEPDAEYFPVTLRIDEASFHFSFSGTVAVPLAQAEDFKLNCTDARLVLRYRNHIIKDETAAELRVVYASAGMAVLFKGREYRLEGRYRFEESSAYQGGSGQDSTAVVRGKQERS
jgi:hypothetical protein